jgi:O-antigen ligase
MAHSLTLPQLPNPLIERAWPSPLPSIPILLAAFALGVLTPALFGKFGLAILFLIAASISVLRRRTSSYSQLSLIERIGIIGVATIIGNFDALGDMFGDVDFRYSWLSLALAGSALPYFLSGLSRELKATLIAVALFLLYLVLTCAVSPKTTTSSLLRSLEINGAYFVTLTVLLGALTNRRTGPLLLKSLVLVSLVNSGFCIYEMLFPNSDISISVSKLGGRITRSAGLYSNPIASGLTTSAVLLAVTIGLSLSRQNLNRDRNKLLVFATLCGISVLITFSRSAMVAYGLTLGMVSYRLSTDGFKSIVRAAFLLIPVVILLSNFVISYLDQATGLHNDAASRLSDVQKALSGDLSGLLEALKTRTIAWEPSKRLWANPTLAGAGNYYLAQEGIFPPHNMIILLLAENGIIGIILFLGLLIRMMRPLSWQPTFQNFYTLTCAILPIFVLIIESHSLFTARYFTLQLATLILTTHVALPITYSLTGNARPQRMNSQPLVRHS